MPTTIAKPKQVIVEGNDEVRVFSALREHLGISGLQVQQCGGYSNLRRFLKTFTADSNFHEVESLAIVADADTNGSGRQQSVQDALSSVGLPVPLAPLRVTPSDRITIAYLIIPHNTEGTMLEDVCLASVSADAAMKCVDEYFECLVQEGASTPKQVWMSKARVHAFLASRDDPALRIGEASDRSIWQFDDDAFRPMRELLTML